MDDGGAQRVVIRVFVVGARSPAATEAKALASFSRQLAKLTQLAQLE